MSEHNIRNSVRILKIVKLVLTFLFIFIIKISLLTAQQDSAKAPPEKVNEKSDTLNRVKSQKDTVYLDRHPQDSPEERGFFLETKDKSSNLRIYSSIRLFGAYDFNGLKGGTAFSITEIPTGSEDKNESSFFMTANLTRFGLISNYQTEFGKVYMKMEADFASEGNHLRLRHAFGRSGFLLAGQTWTVFSDNKSTPNTVDIDGPPTGVAIRSVQIRAFKEFSDGWRLAGSIESPNIKIQIPDTVSLEPVSQVIPDFIVNGGKKFKFGHLQLAGVFRSISVREFSGELDFISGYGGLLSGRIDIFKNYSVMFQTLIGKGITSFLNVSQNSSIDVIFNPSTGSYELLTSYGGFMALIKQFPAVNIEASLIYGTLNILDEDYVPGNFFSFGQYLSVNAFWISKLGFRLGAEYNYGLSENMNSESGTANRFAFTFFYDF
jgi:hypothetical protein